MAASTAHPATIRKPLLRGESMKELASHQSGQTAIHRADGTEWRARRIRLFGNRHPRVATQIDRAAALAGRSRTRRIRQRSENRMPLVPTPEARGRAG